MVATFFVQNLVGTATPVLDFTFGIVEIDFAVTNYTLTSPLPVSTEPDDLVEPNETVVIQLGLLSPPDIAPLVVFFDTPKTVIILDNNSECVCHCTTRSVDSEYNC